MKKIFGKTIALILILSMIVAIIPINVLAEDQNTDLSNLEVTSVSLGGGHSAAIAKDGSLYTWGYNSYGQLGDGSIDDRYSPVKIMSNVASVSLWDWHSAAVTKDGSLYTWGENIWGQLGDGSTGSRNSPIKIMDNVASVTLEDSHSAAVTKDGSLYTWGYNSYGQLGDGSTVDRYSPVKIMDNVASVSLGDWHSAAVTKDGSLYTWGYNSRGQLGDGNIGTRYTPVKIMDNVASVSLGDRHSAAVTKDGSLYIWGANGYGQLGDGSTDDRHSPVKIMDNVASISLGRHHCSAAITKDGSLYTWGYNSKGQLGDGSTVDRYSPVKIMDNVASVSLGSYYSAAITKDGSLYTWGDNKNGELGDGSTDNRYSPVKIMDNVAGVSLWWSHSAVVTNNGLLYTWGSNYNGELGDGSGCDRAIPTLIFGKPADSSRGLTLTDSSAKVILGKTNSADGNYKSFESGKAQSELDSINWSVEDSSIAKVTKRTPVLSADGNSASGPLVEIEGLKPGNTKLIADMSSIDGAGGKQEFDLLVGPAMTLPGTTVSNQEWNTVISQNTQNIIFEVKASLNEPDEEYLNYFGETTKVSLEDTPNSLMNGGGEVSRSYSVSEDKISITVTINYKAESEEFDRLVVIESPVETKKVRVTESDKSSKELDFEEDTWSFYNFVHDQKGGVMTGDQAEDKNLRGRHRLKDSDLETIFSSLIPSTRELVLEKLNEEHGSPHCYGLSNLVIMNKMGLIDTPRLGSYANLNECSINNEDIRSQICLYQFVTQKKDYQKLIIDTLCSKDDKTILKELEEKISKVKNGEAPYSISLFGQFGTEKYNFAHEIVGYAVEYASENNKFIGKNGKSYPARILTYDSNAVEFSTNACILFDSSTGEWEDPFYSLNNNNAVIGAYFNDMTIASPNDSDRETPLNPVIYLDYSDLNVNSFILRKNRENLGPILEYLESSNTQLFSLPSGVSSSEQLVWLCGEEGEYSLVSESGQGEKISFSYRDSNKYISLKADKVIEATITSDGKVKINGNEESFSLTYVTDTPESGEFDTYTLSGNKQGDFELDLSADTVKVNGTDLNGLTLKGNDAIVSDEIIINSNQKELEFGRKNNEVVVLNDQNDKNPEEYTLSDQAKGIVESLNKEVISTLKNEDRERIQDLLDQYNSLSEEDKKLIPQETRYQAAALTDWLNNLNDADTPSDPSESEDPAEPGTQENPSNSSGSQSSGTKDPVSTPVFNDQDGTQKIDTVSQSVSQKIEPTYRIAPGTGISDNTLIGWMIVLTAVLAAGTISHFSKRRFNSKN